MVTDGEAGGPQVRGNFGLSFKLGGMRPNCRKGCCQIHAYTSQYNEYIEIHKNAFTYILIHTNTVNDIQIQIIDANGVKYIQNTDNRCR